jgi:hypothetical protein
MDFEGALRSRLTGAGAVTSLVAQRIYWVDRPQASALPAITLQIISEPREQHMGGFHSRQFVLVQVDGWATSYSQGKALKEAILAALVPEVTINGIKFGTATDITIRDLGERLETQFIHRPSIDIRFNYTPA